MQSLNSIPLRRVKTRAIPEQPNASLYISNVCGNCKYFNSSNGVCNKLADVISEKKELINKCKEGRLFEPSLKMRLGYATYKKIEETES